jgi:hypothetical protein
VGQTSDRTAYRWHCHRGGFFRQMLNRKNPFRAKCLKALGIISADVFDTV